MSVSVVFVWNFSFWTVSGSIQTQMSGLTPSGRFSRPAFGKAHGMDINIPMPCAGLIASRLLTEKTFISGFACSRLFGY